jgi:hypothetical protein
MFHVVRAGPALVLGALVGLSAGCGSGGRAPSVPSDPQEAFQQNNMLELGELLQTLQRDEGKPPSSLADLARREVGWPGGYKQVKDGNIVLLWGAPTREGATDTVLAYEKKAPESGGYVLMQDGKTVKRMTADEFKAAPKVPGTAGGTPK